VQRLPSLPASQGNTILFPIPTETESSHEPLPSCSQAKALRAPERRESKHQRGKPFTRRVRSTADPLLRRRLFHRVLSSSRRALLSSSCLPRASLSSTELPVPM
jgi:hypothetical protein